MDLLNLGKLPWHETQTIYHALAILAREALSLVSPATPYVCIGFHQDVQQEVDLDFCKAKRIPVFRRDLGGGAVYLDGDQLFFHLILHKDNPAVPKRKEAFYEKFLQPIINVYRQIGIPAQFKPVNDVIAGTRKISGSGVGEIGDCIVFVGNLIVDFNYDMMARILKVPDEKFRDKVYKTLKDNLSTIRRELGDEKAMQWDEAALNELMAEEFQRLLGPMQPAQKDEILQANMGELNIRMSEDTWLFQRGKPASGREIKIRAGVNVIQKMHKAPGGLIRADYEITEGRFANVGLSGDFFCFPQEAISRLESALEGKSIKDVSSVIKMFYSAQKIETPGIKIEDWLKVLKG